MKKEIKAEILIKASPQEVWKILTDFDNYPNWNPFIKQIKADLKIGNKIEVRIEPPKAKGMTFKPRILNVEINKKLSWLGHLFFKGLFDGEHIFELIDNEDETTLFIQREKFKGILVPFFKKMLENETLNGFNEMNKSLKDLAEQR